MIASIPLSQQSATEFTGTRVRSKNAGDQIDILLLKVLEEDDYQAFEQLFRTTFNPLKTFCKKLVFVNEVAEELVSEVFFKIWNNRKAISIASSPKAYLYTSVRNIAYDHLRKERKYSLTSLDEMVLVPCEYFDPQKKSEFDELQAQINKAIARLPKQCKLVFQLSRDQGLKYNEIAEKLHLSVKTIETQMGRALKALRKALK